MFDIKDKICLPENEAEPCEDTIGKGDTYCFVIDGASGLSGMNIVDEQSDSAWFARRIRDHLCHRLEESPATPTETILTEIIEESHREYCQAAIEKRVEPPSDSPSAGIALFRQMGDQIIFWGLGDCMGAVQLHDDTFLMFKDSRLCALDGSVLKKMTELHETTGISVIEAKELCNDMLIANRNKRNKEDGYWILDLSGVGIEHAVKACWPVESVKTIFACSDGFAQLADTFGIYEDYEVLFEAIQHASLLDLCEKLFAIQNQDPLANQFPRFKVHDDTSCLWGNVKD